MRLISLVFIAEIATSENNVQLEGGVLNRKEQGTGR